MMFHLSIIIQGACPPCSNLSPLAFLYRLVHNTWPPETRRLHPGESGSVYAICPVQSKLPNEYFRSPPIRLFKLVKSY